MIVASALFLSLRVLGVAALTQSPREMSARLLPWFWSALPIMLITGFVFVLARPTRYFTNPVFGLKLLLLAPAIMASWYLHRRATGAANGSAACTKLVAIVSIMLWLTIILVGRWIAYVDYLLPVE